MTLSIKQIQDRFTALNRVKVRGLLEKRRGEVMLAYTLSGTSAHHGSGYGVDYRNYIANLPAFRQSEIVDELLKLCEQRMDTTVLEAMVHGLTTIELETMATIVLQGTEHEDWEEVRRSLPNAILLWRLSNPTGA